MNECTDLVSLRGRCQIVGAVFGGTADVESWGICRTRSHADSILSLLVYDMASFESFHVFFPQSFKLGAHTFTGPRCAALVIYYIRYRL